MPRSKFTQQFSDSWKNQPPDPQLPFAWPAAGMRCQAGAVISLGPRAWRTLPIIFSAARHSHVATTHVELRGSSKRTPLLQRKSPECDDQSWGEKTVGALHMLLLLPYLHA